MADKVKQKKQSEEKEAVFSKKKSSGVRAKEGKQRSKEFEISIRSQVAAEERAHRIVERLVLEDQITEDLLLNSGNFLSTSHYADVVEERFLSHRCGYPLCNNELSQIPLQKYKISTKTNRVYDITERKCFCSNFCYKVSKYFASQLSSSPVWTRLGESPKTYILLKNEDSSNRSGAGDLMLGRGNGQHNESNDMEDPCCTDEEHGSTENETLFYKDINGQPGALINQDATEPENDGNSQKMSGETFERERQRNSTLDEDFLTANIPPPSSSSSLSLLLAPSPSLISNSSNLENSNTDQSSTGSLCSQNSRTQHTQSRGESVSLKDNVSSKDVLVESVQKVFCDWCTPYTLEYLGISPKMTIEGCKQENPSGSTVNSGIFMEKAARSTIQVDSQSDLEAGSSGTVAQEKVVVKENRNFGKNVACVLPPIDSKSQHTIRRRIVLDKLFQILPDLLSDVKLTVGEISRDLTGLVHTFSLTSQNVTLKPLQWKVLGLALIQVFRTINTLVSHALDSCAEEFDTLLHRLRITQQDLDSVVSPVEGVQLQHPGPGEQGLLGDEALKTSDAVQEKLRIAGTERADYGDMEELD